MAKREAWRVAGERNGGRTRLSVLPLGIQIRSAHAAALPGPAQGGEQLGVHSPHQASPPRPPSSASPLHPPHSRPRHRHKPDPHPKNKILVIYPCPSRAPSCSRLPRLSARHSQIRHHSRPSSPISQPHSRSPPTNMACRSSHHRTRCYHTERFGTYNDKLRCPVQPLNGKISLCNTTWRLSNR